MGQPRGGRCRRCGALKPGRELLWGRCIKPCRVLGAIGELQKRTWAERTDAEVLQEAKDLIARNQIGSRSELFRKFQSVYMQLRKRRLMDDIGFDPWGGQVRGQGRQEGGNPPDVHCGYCRCWYVGSYSAMHGIRCTCGCHKPR